MGGVTVVSGSIKSPDETTALKVKLSIWDTEITMRADGAELGNWPTESVDLRALDATSYEFVAEGDRLIFTPDNPTAFGNHPIVSNGLGITSRRGRRSKRSKEPKAQKQPVELNWDQSSIEEERLVKKRPGRAGVAESTVTTAEKPKDKSSKRRAPKVKADKRKHHQPTIAQPDQAIPPPKESAPVPSPRVVDPAPVASEPVAAAPVQAPVAAAREQIAPQRAPVGDRFEKAKELRHGTWLSVLDKARKFDLFGLDRVPVNESLRGEEHQHTWDHRVAPASGPGKFICTICGEIRRKA